MGCFDFFSPKNTFCVGFFPKQTRQTIPRGGGDHISVHLLGEYITCLCKGKNSLHVSRQLPSCLPGIFQQQIWPTWPQAANPNIYVWWRSPTLSCSSVSLVNLCCMVPQGCLLSEQRLMHPHLCQMSGQNAQSGDLNAQITFVCKKFFKVRLFPTWLLPMGAFTPTKAFYCSGQDLL